MKSSYTHSPIDQHFHADQTPLPNERGQDVPVEVIRQSWPCQWPRFDEANRDALERTRLLGHQSAWLESVTSGLDHSAYLLKTVVDGRLEGLLPLILVQGPIFGRFLVSLPYLNTGGVWARTTNIAQELIDEACKLADELDVKYLELRHETPIVHGKFNFERNDKVHMRLALPETDEELNRSFKSKLRSQIRKSNEHNLTVQFGGAELIDDFYSVFAHNMRDLGTPVFAKKLFQCIIKQFEGNAEFGVVRRDGRAIASGLLVHRLGCTEVPSASCLREFNRTNANMLMYRNLLRRAIEKGSHTFDFGRSSEGSGTYKFKAQWGAKPHPACWQYYVRKGDPNDMRADVGSKQKLVQVWQRLPVWLTKLIGPSIVRGIP
ncbi:FemAB family XrtA/PEP-CTERM system-associated protein [Rhodopirellula sallentina]|uniref:FemAB family XrtA/PEP-CTERM system-associated protein n=1 Tax=Rhodopirellula sallentina TaxID=1263869 RepID=UPI00034D0754|nr:FemAB family XrtA/PEP-CTERM system-associated protein [Rhodopirellula sallentina]